VFPQSEEKDRSERRHGQNGAAQSMERDPACLKRRVLVVLREHPERDQCRNQHHEGRDLNPDREQKVAVVAEEDRSGRAGCRDLVEVVRVINDHGEKKAGSRGEKRPPKKSAEHVTIEDAGKTDPPAETWPRDLSGLGRRLRGKTWWQPPRESPPGPLTRG